MNDAPLFKKVCPNCHKEFDTFYGARKFCSDECRYRIGYPLKDYPERKCKICGKVFKPKLGHQLNCSKECKENWKVSVRRKNRPEQDYLDTVSRCEFCGLTNRLALVVHHINGIESDDFMVLCANCHAIYHRTVGRDFKSERRDKKEIVGILNSVLSH